MPDATPKPVRWYLPNRRWLRFSLRAFLLFVLVLSLPLGWIGSRISNWRAERQLVEEMRSYGVLVGSEATKHDSRSEQLRGWLERTLGEGYSWGDYSHVEFPVSADSNAVGFLPKISRCMPRTNQLLMNDAGIHDASLRGMEQLVKLELLVLDGNELGDAGAAHLNALPSVTHLGLGLTELSDVGFRPLSALPKLQSLDVSGTYVTAEAARQFRAERPEVMLLWAPRLASNATAAARQLRKRGWGVRLMSQTGGGAPLVVVSPPNAETMPPADEQAMLQCFPRISGCVSYFHKSKLASCFVGLEQLEELEAWNLDESALAKLGTSRKLRMLTLSGSIASENGWGYLAKLPALEELVCYDSILPIRSIEHLKSMKSLRRLTLYHPAFVNDDREPQPVPEETGDSKSAASRGIDRISLLSHVEEMELLLTELTDADAKQLGQLSNLTLLNAPGTQISDQGLRALAAASNLKELTVYSCDHITSSGIARFRELRPDVRLDID